MALFPRISISKNDLKFSWSDKRINWNQFLNCETISGTSSEN